MKTTEITNQDLSKSTGELVKNFPALYPVFEQNGIEFCCDGNRPLIDHLTALNIKPEGFLHEINQSLNNVEFDASLPNNENANDIITHILNVYHAPLPGMLDELESKISKIYEVHHEKMPFLTETKRVFSLLKKDLTEHLWKEENILFPFIKELEFSLIGQKGQPDFHCGSIQNPIKQMEFEHDNAGECLEILETNFAKIELENACSTLLRTIQLFKEFKSELHKHIHTENYILHPLAISIEKKLSPCSHSK